MARARHQIEELRRRVERVHGFAIVEPMATLRALTASRSLRKQLDTMARGPGKNGLPKG